MLHFKLELRPLIVVGVIASACTPNKTLDTPAPVAEPTQQRIILGDAEVRTIAEILRLEDRREYDVLAFQRFLDDPHPEVRRRAVLALGRIRDPRSGLRLVAALKDSAPSVRAAAAFALGQFEDTTGLPYHELTLQASDSTNDAQVRAEAVAALGKLRSSMMGDSALEMYGRSKIGLLLYQATATDAGIPVPPARVTEEALLASWRFQRDPDITSRIVTLSRSPDVEIRWRATYALMRLRDPAAVDALLERRHDPDPLVRSLAVRGLHPAAADAAGRRDEAIRALAEATSDPHPHVRINAARALAAFRGAESSAALVRLLDDADPNVVLAAVESLAGADRDVAAQLLAGIARDATARRAIVGAALASLLSIDPDLAIPLIESLSRSQDWLDRVYAARALSGPNGVKAVQVIRELARDSDTRVAAIALGVIADWPSEQTANLKPLLIEQLGSADVGIRAAALRGLAQHATAADLPLLLDAYDRARHDRDNDAARAAVAALGALAKQKVPVQNSFFRRFQRSPDPIVHREVREALGPGNWGELYPIETGRELDYYENIVRTYIAPCLAGAPLPRAVIHTAGGKITIELAAPDAPLTVANFISLAEQGYFDGFRWHRVVPNFVLQDGDPRGDGLGGPGYTIRDEFNQIRYLRGTVGMALDGADTGGSQFFITHSPQPHLDGRYTSFGQVVEGIDVADRIFQDDPIFRIEIIRPAAPRTAASKGER